MYLAKDKYIPCLCPSWFEIVVGTNVDPQELGYYFKSFLKDKHYLKIFQIVEK